MKLEIKRRALLKGGAVSLFGLALAGAFTAPAQAFNNTRYVSADGSDSNPGTELSPWKTPARVVAAFTSGELKRGDAAMFRRGDTFFGKLDMPSTSGTGGTGVATIGAYGTGARPKLFGYKISNDAWVQSSTGVWRLDLRPNSGQYYGNQTSVTNVGFLRDLNSGVMHGQRRSALSGLTNPMDWYSDDTAYVYVKSASSPGANIGISIREDGVRLTSSSVLEDVHIEGWGAHGIATGGSSNITIRRNVIQWIGGSRLKTDGTRYGNCLELWIGSSNVVTEYNTFRGAYDVAYTMQGENGQWADNIFRFNRIENCTMGFEVWSGGSGNGHVRCKVTDNIFVDSGFSWGREVRSDTAGSGTHILVYTVALPMDIEVTRNQFLGARDNYLRCSGDRQVPNGMNLHHNTIKLGAGKKIAYSPSGENPETIEQYEQWRTRTGQEAGSTFAVLPSEQCVA